jgi:ketosteroid isomerase-like protein
MMTMADIIGEYFDAISGIDRQAYLACFSHDAIVLDPYGGRPLQGIDGLNKFMDGMERTWSGFTMKPGESFASGARVAVNWTAVATAKTGRTAEFAGINVFTMDDNGLVSQLEGYWDFKAMLAQIS